MSAIDLSARYLLRVDDLCPTMNRARWRAVKELILAYGIRPILAVVPNNQDPELDCDTADPNFWKETQSLERQGATIALHGLNHVCSSYGRGLIPLHTCSEFAGSPLEDQRQRIRDGLQILQGHGLNPRAFVAPRHGLDRNTLIALRAEGIEHLSDGFAITHFVQSGVTWIPQQLWAPVPRKRGLWTLCLHPNTMEDIEPWREFFLRYAHQFTSFDEVIQTHAKPLTTLQRSGATLRLARILVRRAFR